MGGVRTLLSRSETVLVPGNLGIIFGLFVAFTATQVWTDTEKAKAEIDREASALRSVVILATTFPKEAEEQLRGLIRRYKRIGGNDVIGWTSMGNGNGKSLESWIWDAACSIRGAKDAPKYKEFILPLIFAKRLCDVFDDELNRIADEVGSRAKAFKLVKHDKKLVRFYLPLEPKNPDDAVWSVIRTLSDKIGEQLTTHLRAIADANPLLKGIIDRVDFNATTHGVRDLADDRLSNLIEAISAKRLGLADVEPDIIGRSYEYLIRKFAEGSVSSAGEFYTPTEVGFVMARIMNHRPAPRRRHQRFAARGVSRVVQERHGRWWRCVDGHRCLFIPASCFPVR